MASPLIAITMGMVVVACLATRVPGVPWVMRTSTFVAISSATRCREPTVDPFCPAKLDNNIRTLNVAEFAEPRSE